MRVSPDPCTARPAPPAQTATMAEVSSICMGCRDAACAFVPLRMLRRAVGEHDVLVEMKYCGVCHSDLHLAAGHLSAVAGKPKYPMVPGHELSGVCTQVGVGVTRIKVGDSVGIGCMVDACLECSECLSGHEQKCKKTSTSTYGDSDKHGRAKLGSSQVATAGGYSSTFVVHERFAVLIPATYPLEMAGPVMCSGVTMYEPLKTFGCVDSPKRIGIVGLGGLGVMGVKIAKALNCHVTCFSRTDAKKASALKMGADAFVATANGAELLAVKGSLDLILNTIPASHDSSVYTALLAKGGRHVLLGLSSTGIACLLGMQLTGGKSAEGFSMIGGIKNTEEVLALCDKYKIYPEIEIRPVDDLNAIFELLDKSNDTGLRYVLDIAGSLNEQTFDRPVAAAPSLKPGDEAGVSLSAVLYKLFTYNLWVRS
mmetsp:Transcript_895/g.3324  ORF Transcript_895/g.3324 Transcript_895/m.3324 type:complete len:426 (+) Transcript_895:41-1318(+)